MEADSKESSTSPTTSTTPTTTTPTTTTPTTTTEETKPLTTDLRNISEYWVSRCYHCRQFYNGSCLHPMGFYPPITECGWTKSVCGSILLKLEPNLIRTIPPNEKRGKILQIGLTFEGML